MTPVCRITAECIQRTAVELWKYFVTVLVGLLHCDAAHTLSGLLRQVAIAMSVSGLSRFLKSLAWSTETLTVVRQERFNAQVVGEDAEAHVRKRTQRSRRAGRPSKIVVIGFLIMDDSTHVKRYARKDGPSSRLHTQTTC